MTLIHSFQLLITWKGKRNIRRIVRIVIRLFRELEKMLVLGYCSMRSLGLSIDFVAYLFYIIWDSIIIYEYIGLANKNIEDF